MILRDRSDSGGTPINAVDGRTAVTYITLLDKLSMYTTCMYMANDIVPTKSGQGQLSQLRAWAETTERDIQEIKEAIAPLQEKMENASQRLDLIKRLIHLSEAGATRPKVKGDHQHTPRPAQTANIRPETVIGLPSSLEDHIEDILQLADSPMHVSEIRETLIERGLPLPGKGEEANIIVRMGRSENRFVRTGKGTYGLSSWNFQPVTPTRKVRSRRRSKRINEK